MKKEVNALKNSIINKLANLKNNDEFFDDKKQGYEDAIFKLNDLEDILYGLEALPDNFYDLINTEFENKGKKYEAKARLYKSDERIDNIVVRKKGKTWSEKIQLELSWELEEIAENEFKKLFIS